MMIFGFSLYDIALYFLVYSCLGWCAEVAYAAVTTGQLVNRGFLNGPVCPIYGFGMVALLLLLAPVRHSLLLTFLGGVLIPSAIELVGGWALYRIYHTRWWDYSDAPFNLGGYICLEFSLIWGLGALFVLRIIHPILAGFLHLMPENIGWIIMLVLYLLYLADLIFTAFTVADLARDLDTLETVADGLRELSDAMTRMVGTKAMDADQRMDEGRLQFKLAKAELRDAAKKYSAREVAATARAMAEEAIRTARQAGEDARLSASEAANAARLAALGTVERTTDQLRLEQLKNELEIRSEEMQAHLHKHSFFGPGRLLRAFPKMRHGARNISLDTLREALRRRK